MKTLRTLWTGIKSASRVLGAFGRIVVVLVGLCGVSTAIANYTMTQGSGTTFASVVISTVHYAVSVICDATAGSTQCAAVDTHGQQQIDVGTTNNNLYAAVIAPVPCQAQATWNTNTGLTGTQATRCDGSAVQWIDLGAVGGSVFALGQQLAAASLPVVLPALQVTALTPIALNDPCGPQNTKLGAPISLTASGQVITGTSAKKTYICAIDVVPTAAQNIALVEGTGSVCATNIFGLAGGTTAATGWNFQLGGGIARGSGNGTVYSPSADTNGTAANVCLLIAGAGQVSGQVSYVQQ